MMFDVKCLPCCGCTSRERASLLEALVSNSLRRSATLGSSLVVVSLASSLRATSVLLSPPPRASSSCFVRAVTNCNSGTGYLK